MRAHSSQQRRSKYGAVQTVGDDGTAVYDSRLEAECARVLDLLAKQGRIVGYERQRVYELAPARKERALRACSYVADFCVAIHPYGQGRTRHIVIEAKGVHTAAGRLKIRWFGEVYPQIPVRVVRAPEEIIALIEDYEYAEVRVGQRGEEATQRGAIGAACRRQRPSASEGCSTDGAGPGERGCGDPGAPAHAALPLRRV